MAAPVPVTLDLVTDVVLVVVAAVVLLCAVAANRSAGDRGVLLDAAILGAGAALAAWAVSAGVWPDRPLDTAGIGRIAAAMATLGLALPLMPALPSRRLQVVGTGTLVAHAVGQALSGGGGSGPSPALVGTLVTALACVLLVRAAAHQSAGQRSRGLPGAATRELLSGVLPALSWVAAPALLVVLQAVDVSVSTRPLILGWVVMVVLAAVRSVDLSTRLARERDERDAARQFRGAFDQAMIGLALVEIDGPDRGRLVEVNQAMCRVYGMARADLLGRSIETLVGMRAGSRDGDGPVRQGLERRHQDRPLEGLLDRLAEQRRVALPSEVPLPTADGRGAWGVVTLCLADGGRGTQAVLQIEDVTEQRTAREHLSHLSLQDPLTGLANQRHLDDRLASASARGEGLTTPVALLLVDLDRFGAVNERHGAQAGDEILVEVGARLRAVTRPQDVVARLGADHFAVLLVELTSAADAPVVAQRIVSALARPYHVNDAEVSVTARIGVTVARGSSPGLLADARLAVDRAKRTRSVHPVFVDDELRAGAVDRVGIADDLRSALAGSGLRVVYQPVVAVHAETAARPVIGWEALLRWDRPGPDGTRQEQAPGAFLDVAESSGLLVPVGHRVLEIALAALDVLPEPVGAVPTMSVNFSGGQLTGRDAAARVIRAVETARLAPDRLCVEVSEIVLADGRDEVMPTLRRLREHGIRVAMDDFGTGHSSLSLLRRLPIDTVKIGIPLVAAMARSRADEQVVTGLVQLAGGLGLTVAAAGVETAQTDQVVQRLGVSAAQGWRYGRPAPAPWPHGEPRFSPLGSQRRPTPTDARSLRS